jgi:hypothetical protein
MPYHHTQIAFITLGAFLVIGLICIGGALLLRSRVTKLGLVGVAAVLLVVALIFSTLTVDVGEKEVTLFFGPGLWSYRLDRTEIQSVAVVRNPWQYGWGIRMGPGFRLYNVQGLDAVELRLKSAEVTRIGTDEVERLAAALKR